MPIDQRPIAIFDSGVGGLTVVRELRRRLPHHNLVYFGDNAGVIHAVDFRGQGQWTARVEAPVRSAGTILAPGRVAFGLDNETLMVLKCSSQGLAQTGWPKIGGSLGQCGLV